MDKRCLHCDELIHKDIVVKYPNKKYCNHECQKKHYKSNYKKLNPHIGISRSTVGTIGELRVAVDLMSKKKEVFRALSPATSCDLAIIDDGKLKRIEVKTGYKSASGKICWPKIKKGKFDILAVIVGEEIKYIDF